MRAKGFSLLEVVVTIAILAILSAASTQVYREPIQRGHTLAAKNALMKVAAGMENYALIHEGYAGASFVELNETPYTSDGAYKLFMVTANAVHFVIEAQPSDLHEPAYAIDETGQIREKA